MQHASVTFVGPAPNSLAELLPDLMALIASSLPGEIVADGLAPASASPLSSPRRSELQSRPCA